MRPSLSLLLCALACVARAQDGTSNAARDRVGPAAAGTCWPLGNGCPGSGAGNVRVLALNGDATQTQAGSNNNQFALHVANPTAAAIAVTGFELFTTSVTGAPVVLQTEVYAGSAALGPQGLPVRTGTMRVGTTPAFYRTTFAALNLPPAGEMFLSFVGDADVLHPRTTLGHPVGVHWYRSTTVPWTGPFLAQPWAWRVLEAASTGATPQLTHVGTPTLNSTFRIELSEALAATRAICVFGVSNQSYGAIPLPFDLAPIGAPGCNVLISIEFTVDLTTDAAGGASLPITLPNNPTLLGARFFNQWYVVDPSTPLLVVSSNAGAGVIG